LFFIPIPNLKSRIERDSASWNLEEEEIQRRRNIFWEFFFWDCWAVSALQHVLVLFRTLGYCRAYYMGVLLFWISRTRIVDFPEILTRTRCRLASRSLAVSCLFLRPTFLLVSDFFPLISPLMEGSLLCGLPLGSSTAHVFRASDELFIPSRTR
jgi:Fungal specific transcription factor domain